MMATAMMFHFSVGAGTERKCEQLILDEDRHASLLTR